jgi:glucose/arabinose dehydrogenase
MHSPIRLLLAVLLLTLATGCGGGGGGGGGGEPGNPPADLTYATSPAHYDAESTITPNVASWSGGDPTSFTVVPALPEGLALDGATGVISGTTTKRLGPTRVYTITAANADGATSVDLELTVGVLEQLADGFAAEIVANGLAQPAKFALAPDGRIFFNELDTGDTRVLLADGTLRTAPFAENDVLTGPHQGLLGVVCHPDFVSNGWVYVLACTAGVGMTPDRIQVIRYTDTPGMDAGTNRTVIVDDLPLSAINNGGDLVFGIETPSPHLYVSLGDTENPLLAQTDGARPGRVLRYAADGSIPADNPVPGDPEWVRGLRNTFGIDVQPETGDLFGADNGPDSGDELNYLRKGKNFEWGGLPPGFPPGDVGIVMQTWVDVIVPTGLAWHDGTGWGAAYENDLFLSSYDDQVVRRFQVSGASFVNVDVEETFARFQEGGIDHKPLDVEVGTDGSLYVSTFTGIYRIFRP